MSEKHREIAHNNRDYMYVFKSSTIPLLLNVDDKNKLDTITINCISNFSHISILQFSSLIITILLKTQL